MAKQSHNRLRTEWAASLVSTAALLAALGATAATAQQPSPEELKRRQQQQQQQQPPQQQRSAPPTQQQPRSAPQQQGQPSQQQQQQRQGGQQQQQGRPQPPFLPSGRQPVPTRPAQSDPARIAPGTQTPPPGTQRGQTPPLPGNLPNRGLATPQPGTQPPGAPGAPSTRLQPPGTQTPPPGTQRGQTPPLPGNLPNRGLATPQPGTQPPGAPGAPPARVQPPGGQATPGGIAPTQPSARPGVPFTPPSGTAGGAPGRFQPPAGVPGGGSPGGSAFTRPGIATPSAIAAPAIRPIAGPRVIDEVRKGRVETVNRGGQRIIQEPGNRTIVRHEGRSFVTRNEATHVRTFQPGARTTVRSGGISETVFVRPGGARVFTETDSSGRLVRRYRREPTGREIVLVDNRRFYRNLAVGVGAGIVAGAVILALSRPAHAVPRHQYVVNYVGASDEDCYVALTAPPVVRLERTYSLDEIRYNEPLRAHVRRIDLDNITFDTGSFEVTPEQYSKLDVIARAMGRAIEANPSEVFMIEGHTDAVGATEDNLSLSDRRAESVMRILAEHYNIPIENLVTQGYGEQYPKVETDAAERSNRRVAVRRITPLLNQQS